MKDVCVITGGGSGMGLSTAKYIGTEYKIVLTGRTEAKLEGARKELEALGLDVELAACDVSDRGSVQALADRVNALGPIKAVIHAAGVSPTMGNAEYIFTINALGTVYVNEVFGEIMADGGCIIDVASMAAHMMPPDQLPRALYPMALDAPVPFCEQMVAQFSALPAGSAEGYAYSVSKDFAIWFAQQSALKYGNRGIRVLSVSPGTFETPMGEAEGEQAANMAKQGALGRMGHPDEIGSLMAFLAVGSATYLTATDILCDGGTIAAVKKAMQQSQG